MREAAYVKEKNNRKIIKILSNLWVGDDTSCSNIYGDMLMPAVWFVASTLLEFPSPILSCENADAKIHCKFSWKFRLKSRFGIIINFSSTVFR